MIPVLLLLAAYLIGGIPFGYLLVRLTTGADVRGMGSGNIGATNVLRTTGRLAGVVTLVLDIVKGWVAVWLMGYFTKQDPLWLSLAAIAVILGHAYSIFLKFQGGKAVASFVGAFLYLTPLTLAATAVLFIAAVWYTRYISFGSIAGAALFPLGVWLIEHPAVPVLAASIVGGFFIIWRHQSNWLRLRAGTENVFTFGKRPA